MERINYLIDKLMQSDKEKDFIKRNLNSEIEQLKENLEREKSKSFNLELRLEEAKKSVVLLKKIHDSHKGLIAFSSLTRDIQGDETYVNKISNMFANYMDEIEKIVKPF